MGTFITMEDMGGAINYMDGAMVGKGSLEGFGWNWGLEGYLYMPEVGIIAK